MEVVNLYKLTIQNGGGDFYFPDIHNFIGELQKALSFIVYVNGMEHLGTLFAIGNDFKNQFNPVPQIGSEIGVRSNL